MNRLCIPLAALLLAAAAHAQQAGPGLHHRTAAEPDGAPPPEVATGHTSLPAEAEGEYPWGRLGEEIDIYFDGGKLHGYMTERSDPTNDQSAPVTFDFATTHADGHAVAWTTRRIHDEWWSFDGHVERGLTASPAQPGYYLLTGTLTRHRGSDAPVSRTVALKREPGSS